MTTVRYQFSAPEAIRTMLRVRRWNHPWELTKGTLAGIAGAGLVVGVYVLNDGGRRHGLAAVTSGLMICLLPVLYLATWLRVRGAIARRVNSNPQITSPEELSFDDTSLTLSSGLQRQVFTWTVFPYRRHDDLYFYLFSGAGGVFMIVPRRAFDDAGLAEFLRCGQFSQPV